MDFVVSKVAMSVCALMLMTVVGGVVENSISMDESNELEEVLSTLKGMIALVSTSGSACKVSWNVPGISGGEEIGLSVHSSYIEASSGVRELMMGIEDRIHIWSWDGEPLNQTELVERDMSVASLDLQTGDRLCLETCRVLIDEELTLMVFVSEVI